MLSEPNELIQAAPVQFGSPRLKEIVLLFLRLGATAFGGPAAHLASMHAEVVKRRR